MLGILFIVLGVAAAAAVASKSSAPNLRPFGQPTIGGLNAKIPAAPHRRARAVRHCGVLIELEHIDERRDDAGHDGGHGRDDLLGQ